MKLRFKRLFRSIAAFSLAAFIVICSACSQKDGTGFTFKYDISQNPRTLDPQTATDSASYEIISNMFDGLFRIDKDGNIQNAVAENYTVSADGLTYTFDLRKDVYWCDRYDFEAQCTANDFVFAFQRLFKPSTKSKTASGFFCIKNSEAINKGKITDLSELGVKAEGDFKLIIQLEAPTPSLLSLLTTPPAMPCNEKFYDLTNGRYGLYADAVASNGSFLMYQWSYDQWSTDNNYIILRANTKNNANNEIAPRGLNFFIDSENCFQNFVDEARHVYIASGEEAIQLLNKGYEYTENENRVWGIVFNTKSKAFKNVDLRKALSYSINRDKTSLESDVGYN